MDEQERLAMEQELRENADALLKIQASEEAEASGCAPLIYETITVEHVAVKEDEHGDVSEIIEAVVRCDDNVRRRVIYEAISDEAGYYSDTSLDWVDELD